MKFEWKTCLKVGVTVVLIYLCIHFLPMIVGFGSELFDAMTSMIVGAIIAYLVNILMSFYEKHYFPGRTGSRFVNKTRRPVCLTAAFLTMIAVIALIMLLIVPELVECTKTLVAVIPPFLRKAVDMADDISWIPQQVIQALNAIDWQSMINKLVNAITSGVGDFFSVITTAVSTIFSVVVTSLFAVIFSIYLLYGKDKFLRGTDRLLAAYAPKKVHDRLVHLGAIFNDCFHRYIVGQCIEAVILGALCTIGMLILRLPYATMIGALTAFTALVPIAGAYIGAFVGAFMIMTVSPIKALIFLIFLITLQQLEGNLIYPRVVGTSIGLPSVWVLVAITVGGGLWGIMGMFLGVPIAAAIYRLVKEDLARREDIMLRAAQVNEAWEPGSYTPVEAEPRKLRARGKRYFLKKKKER